MRNKLLIGLLILSSWSCERIFISPNPDNSPQAVFDQLWTTVDEGYTYFDYKNVDWDQVYTEQVGRIQDNMSEDSLFEVLSDVLFELRDGHVNLSGGFNFSRNWDWFQDFPANYNSNFVEQTYLGRDYFVTGSLVHQVLRDNIGYIRYSSFANGITTKQLDFVLGKMADTKGLIIDVRDNGGGNPENGVRMMSRFIRTPITVAEEFYKAGPEHDDFTTPDVIVVEPTENLPYLKPIVVLTNRSCYSACNLFAGFMSLLPQVTIIGDQSGGGGGLPISSELLNGWRFRYSGSRMILSDGIELEGGVPVDIAVATGAAEELQGVDAIIEAAINLLK